MELSENVLDHIVGGCENNILVTAEEREHIYSKCDGDKLKAEQIIYELTKQRQDEYIRDNNNVTSLENNRISK